MKRLGIITILLVSQMGATDCGQVLRDPGFDLWCGDELCAWKVVRGDIQRVGTWNKGDSGVEFLGEDSAIQQTAPVNNNDGHCIEFTMIADVADNADVFLDIDLQADGTVEREERVPTSNWKKVSFHIFIQGPYDGIRFELAKHGTGHAVLANIGAELSSACEGLEPIESAPRPNGSSCVANEDCASNICGQVVLQPPGGSPFGTMCMGCDFQPGSCGTGEVCGLGDPLSPVLAVPVECVPEASRVLGEQCVNGNQCVSGICSAPFGGVGSCSACTDGSCAGGAACAPAWFIDFVEGPHICSPGRHIGMPGDACGTNDDCSSSHCAGPPRQVCTDGRPCADNFGCPAGSDLKPGICSTVGVEGGTCD